MISAAAETSGDETAQYPPECYSSAATTPKASLVWTSTAWAWIVLDSFTCASRSTTWISLQIVPQGESRSHCTTQTNMHQEPHPARVHKNPFMGPGADQPDAQRGSCQVRREAGQLTGSGWGTWAQCSAVVRQDAALSSFLLFRYCAYSEGILKQIMNSTDNHNGAAVTQCQKSFSFMFTKAALAGVSTVQSCHTFLALLSLIFVTVLRGEKTP